jgi:hypothetical protein
MKSGVRKKVKPEKHSDSKVREPFHIKDWELSCLYLKCC